MDEIEALPFYHLLASHGYVLLEKIGKGGYSVIYKVRSSKYEEVFVAKVIELHSTRKKRTFQSFQNEVDSLSRVFHPNVITFYDHFFDDQYAVIILEYCSSGNLKAYLKTQNGACTSQTIDYMKQLLEAVAFIHSKNICHSDIKPANVFFDSHGRIKLADFGMSYSCEPGLLVQNFCGSIQYLAPEVHNYSSFDPYFADIWSLGITFLEMATGSLPWPKETKNISTAIVSGGVIVPATLRTDISKMVLRMTKMNPQKRPSATKLLEFPIWKSLEKAMEKICTKKKITRRWFSTRIGMITV